MLVLSRKVGERVLIGDQIAVTVVRIGPNAVRLGIEAPKELNIVREELLARIRDESGTTPTEEEKFSAPQ
ncbi:MAG: carbon storage regulator [Planctomycetota bacterium]|nr:MAG: carbon storage regulator [Planctomycetota bacterium]